MATGDELYQQLIKIKNTRPKSVTSPRVNNFGPSQEANLSYRDSVVNAIRNAPTLSNQISAGQTQSPPSALGNIGRFVVGNPLVKGVLSGLDTIDKPKRFIISGIKEFKDAIDNNPTTKASLSDFGKQINDPLFGFGRVYARDGWGGRIVGLIGDLALDPINWLTLGGAIAPRAAVSATRLVGRELAEGAATAVVKATPTNTRAFLGTKTVSGRSGAAALAEGLRKLGADEATVAAVFKNGRLAVPGAEAVSSGGVDYVKLMGLNNYGLTMFGSRVKLPFTGTLAKGLASGITKSRHGIVNTKYGEKIFKAFTAGGTSQGFNLQDIRFALRSGKPLPAGLTPRMASAIMASETSSRAAKKIAANQGAQIIRKALEDENVIAEADSIYKVLDKAAIPTDATPRQLKAAAALKVASDELYEIINSYGLKVGGGNPGDFEIAKWRSNWFPHKMTQAARDFTDNATSQRAIDVRQYMMIDHSNIGGSFESRNLERAVRSGGKPVDWFGHTLTEADIDKGVDRLNELARLGGFKGDFFETNINKAFTSYLENFSEAIGTIAFYQGLKESGTDIASMAVTRGMITKEAMESLLGDVTRAERAVQTKMSEALSEVKKGVDLFEREAKRQIVTASTKAGLSAEQIKLVREGAPAVDFTENLAVARVADDLEKQAALKNLNAAKNNIASKRAELAKAQSEFAGKLESDSLVLSDINAQERAMITILDTIETRISNYIDDITGVDEITQAVAEKASADLKILNNQLAVLRNNAEAKVASMGLHSVEFINDAMKTIQSYTLGEKYSGPVKDLQELATHGKVMSGNLSQVSRGIEKPLGKTNNQFRINKLLSLKPVTKQAGVDLSPSAQLDNAWVELRDTLGILQEKQIVKGLYKRLNSLTINDVRATLARAMASADPSELGAVRESITWLIVRTQLDDPTFAQRMLVQPTKEFESIRLILNNQRIRDKFGFEAFAKTFTDGYTANVVDIDKLPAKLQQTAKAINLYSTRNALDAELDTIAEHLSRVPDVDRNPIYDTVYQMLSTNEANSIIPQKYYSVLADEILRVNPIADDSVADSFIRTLRESATGTEPRITVNQLLDLAESLFPAPIRKNLANDFRLTAEERSLYLTPEMIKRNVSLRSAIIQKQNKFALDRAQANEDMIRTLSRLDKEAKEELSIVLNTEEIAKLTGTNLSEDSKSLARAAADFYLAEETRYVLRMADETLAVHGVALTQEGHGQLMNNVYSSFIDAQEKHLVNLHSAENIMRDLAEKTLNAVPAQGGRSQLDSAKRAGVANMGSVETSKLTFIETMREYLKDPKSKEILTTVFPDVVLALGRRQSTLKTEAKILASSASYAKAIEQIADLEITFLGVGRTAQPGGAGVVDFKSNLGNFKPGSKEDIAQRAQVSRVESQRRLQESTLGSPELQKQQLLSVLQMPTKHSVKLAAVEKIRERFIKEVLDPLRKDLQENFNRRQRSGVEQPAEPYAQLDTLGKEFKAQVDIVLKSLKDSYEDAMQADKELKALAIAAGGPKSGQRRALQREAVRQGGVTPRTIDERIFELAPNTAGVKLSQMLRPGNNSRTPIKEFFGTILGGDEFATPTVRGSEAQRLAGEKPSMRVIRREDSFFGRTIPTMSSLRDEISKRLYSSDPNTSEFFYEKVRYAEYLRERLTNLERLVKEKPGAMKLLAQATKELEKAEKATGGLSVEQRLKYIDSLSIATGERANFTRTWDMNANDWVISRPRGSTLYGFPKDKPGRPPLSGPVLDRVDAAKGIPIPESAFTGIEQQYIKSYLAAFSRHSQFVRSEEYALAQRAYSEKLFKDALAEYDLPAINWTIGGDTATSRAYSQSDYRLINDAVTKQGNYPVTNDDFFVEPVQKITNLSNLFTKNKKHLIQRMDDISKPPLIFIDSQGLQKRLRLARDVDGTPNGLFEIQEDVSLVGMGFDESPGSETIAARNAKGDGFVTFDPSKSSLTIIDSDTVDDIDPALKAYKRLRLNDNGGQGTIYDPNNVWVRHNPVRDSNKDVLEQEFANPPYFKRLSEYLPTAAQIPRLKNFDGEDLVFTAIEQESLYTDFNTPTYRGIRGVTGKAFPAEVARREKAVADYAKALLESQQNQSRNPKIRAAQQMAVKNIREVLDIAQKDLADYFKAAELWDAHFSANRKVAHLYNLFDENEATNMRTLLGVTATPQNGLRNYLKTQTNGLKGSDISSVDEVIKTRKSFATDEWAKLPDSKVIAAEQQLNKLVQEQMNGFGTTDLNVVKNLLKSRQQIGAIGASDGLRADMELKILEKELSQPKLDMFGVNVADTSMAQMRQGVESIERQVQKNLIGRPMVRELSPGANLKALEDAKLELDIINQDPRNAQIAALQAELDWAKTIRGEMISAAEKEMAKKEVIKSVGIVSGKKKIKFENIEKARQDAINVIQKTMAQDPFLMTADEFAIDYVPKEVRELSKAQNAFDAASVLDTPSAVSTALQRIDDAGRLIEKGAGIKKSAKGVKSPEEYKNFVTEYQLFQDEITPFLRVAASPTTDKAIADQMVKFANANLEYMKQVASLTEAQRLNLVVQGMGRSSYYGGKAGSQELREGRLLNEELAMEFADKKTAGGKPMMEWLQHFDDGMVKLGKQFPNIAVAPQIAEFVQNVHTLREPAIAMELNRFLGKYTRFFKAYATLSPGFHVRNSLSNGFMLFAAGGKPRYLLEGMQLSSSLNEASKAGKSVEQWIASLPIEKQTNARIAVRASAASGGGDAADRLRNLYLSGRLVNNVLTRNSKALGIWIEGHSRFMLAYDGAMQGMDFDMAAARVQRFLIDYEDVSTVDKSLRQIIPFWMWTSRNLPMQVQNIWLNPKAYQAYGNFKRNFMEDREEKEVVPVWMRDMGAWKLPFGQNLYATPDFGFSRIKSDVNQLQDPARLLSNVNPLLRLPVELIGDRQLFSNRRFSTTPVEMESFPGTALQPLMQLLGYGETNTRGQKFVDDKAYYALRNLLPLLGRAESLTPSIPTDPAAATSNSLLGFLGAPVKEVSQKMQDSELKRRQFELQNLVKNYKAVNNPQG